MKNTHREHRRLVHGCRSRSPSRCSAEKGPPAKAGATAACLSQPWTCLRPRGCQTWCRTRGGGSGSQGGTGSPRGLAGSSPRCCRLCGPGRRAFCSVLGAALWRGAKAGWSNAQSPEGWTQEQTRGPRWPGPAWLSKQGFPGGNEALFPR